MSFGVHIAVFFTCSYYLWKSKRTALFYQAYIFLLFALAAINIACNINYVELTWIDERNYPGGPAAFIQQQEALPVHTLGDAAANAITLLVDGLMIYRLYVVWNSNWYITIIPLMMLITSITLAILRTIAAAQPLSSLWAASAERFGLPYWAISMTLNVVVTVLIIGRLFWARKQLRETMGPSYGTMYTGVAAMLIESAVPYAIISFILIVLYGIGNTANVLFVPLYCQVQCISPELILLRVYRGHGWTKDTMTGSYAGNPDESHVRFRTQPSDPSSTYFSSERLGSGSEGDSEPPKEKAHDLSPFEAATRTSLDARRNQDNFQEALMQCPSVTLSSMADTGKGHNGRSILEV